jgi:hypothetical protein
MLGNDSVNIFTATNNNIRTTVSMQQPVNTFSLKNVTTLGNPLL